MRKDRLFKKRSLKAVIAVALAVAMAIPVTTNLVPVIADETAVETVVPKRLLDFNEGLKEYYEDEQLKLEIVKTEDVYVYKPEAERESNDRVDANDLLIMGNGSGAYYKLYTISNQPSTYVDAERGTVLYMGKTITLDAVKKTKSADVKVKNADGTETADNEATLVLDEAVPVPEGEDKTIQPEMTVRSELNFTNPIADSTSKFTVSMWIKIPSAEGVNNELAGSWHYVVVTSDGDVQAYYLDGVLKEDANVIDNIKAWVASGEKLSIGGDTDSGKAFAAAFKITDADAAIMVDDLGFYNVALSAEKVAADFAEATKEVKPVANKISMSDFADISKFPADAGLPGVKEKESTLITTSKETVNGQSEDVINVAENKKASQSTGAYIKNPFAGKSLDGATISFWTKQSARDKVADSETMSTPVFSFIGSKKMINHEKSNAKGEAWSMLSVTSDGSATFKEGFSDDGVGNKLGNMYTYLISTEDHAKYDVTQWYNVTVVMNNAGIKMYINGVLYENNALDAKGKSIAAGGRFLDGYFQRAADELDPTTKYNIFGGSNNQYATALMSFLTGDDVNFFLGYRPSTGSSNVKSNPTCYAGIRTFDTDLTAEQVVALYNDSTVFDGGNEEPTPTPGGGTPGPSETPGGGTPGPSETPGASGETLLGDADTNGKVDLQDASLVLKVALNITTLDGQAAINADADTNGKIELSDAVLVLKAALNIATLG